MPLNCLGNSAQQNQASVPTCKGGLAVRPPPRPEAAPQQQPSIRQAPLLPRALSRCGLGCRDGAQGCRALQGHGADGGGARGQQGQPCRWTPRADACNREKGWEWGGEGGGSEVRLQGTAGGQQQAQGISRGDSEAARAGPVSGRGSSCHISCWVGVRQCQRAGPQERYRSAPAGAGGRSGCAARCLQLQCRGPALAPVAPPAAGPGAGSATARAAAPPLLTSAISSSPWAKSTTMTRSLSPRPPPGRKGSGGRTEGANRLSLHRGEGGGSRARAIAGREGEGGGEEGEDCCLGMLPIQARGESSEQLQGGQRPLAHLMACRSSGSIPS